MTGLVLIILVIIGVVALAVVAGRRNQARELERKRTELEPVQKLAFEDVTALGTDLQDLDGELAGHELDPGARADYQRALDAYLDYHIEMLEEVEKAREDFRQGRTHAHEDVMSDAAEIVGRHKSKAA